MRFLDLGLAELEREADLQIRPDGTSVEQSFGYHVFVLDLLVVAAAALDSRAVPSRPGSMGLWRAPETRYGRRSPTGSPRRRTETPTRPRDSCSTDRLRTQRAIGGERHCGAPRSRAGRSRRRRASTRRRGGCSAQEGATRFDRLEPAVAAGLLLLPDGGLTSSGDGGRATDRPWSARRILSIAAHAHADALRSTSRSAATSSSSTRRRKLLRADRIREAFRGTAVHATVTVDGVSSSVAGGAVPLDAHASRAPLRADLEDGLVIAEHDGLHPPRRPCSPSAGARARRTTRSSSSTGSRRASAISTRSAGRCTRISSSSNYGDDRSSARGTGAGSCSPVAARIPPV